MDVPKKLKLIPLHQFYKAMDRPSRWMYLPLYLALVVAVIGMVAAFEDPSRWSVSIESVHNTLPEEVTLRTYSANYREMTTEITAWKESVMYYATPITPASWLVCTFILLQVLGWAYLLTAASYLRGFLAYLFYFLFAMAIFLSQAFEAIAPGQFWLINAGLAVLIFAPAYLFQQQVLRWRFAFRLLLNLGITALPFGIIYTFQDWVGLHTASVGMFPLLAFVALAFVIFVGKDISQLLFFAATNMPRRSMRATFPIMLTSFLIILGLEFVMLQEAMGWHLIPVDSGFPLRPVYLLALVGLLMPGLNQNFAYVVKGSLDNRGFSVLLTAVSLLAVSALGFHAGLGEYLYAYTFERLCAMLFLLGSLLHFFYMYYNFGDLLRARLNFYFISMMPKRLMFVFVLATMVLGTFTLDASEGLKTQRLLVASAYNRAGDVEMLAGRYPEAATFYQSAVGTAAGTVKGNYNQAMLVLKSGGDLQLVRDALRRASSFRPFAPAWINLGNLELDGSSPELARNYLREGLATAPNAFLASNLAQVHLALREPDSAVIAYQTALRLSPHTPALYANLGGLYLQYDKPEAARDFLAAGLALPTPDPSVVTNALFLNMKYGTDPSTGHKTGLHVSDSLLDLPEIAASRTTSFNFAVERYHRRDTAGTRLILERLLKAEETGDALLLDGMLRFDRGEIESAISRMEYLDINFPEYAGYTQHFLGVGFFGEGVPEMAASHFHRSYLNGRTEDLFHEAVMEIDRGDHDYGFIQLNMARQQDTSLFSAVAREEALLQAARGEYFFASIGFDLGSLTAEEWIRAGLYAGKIGNLPGALEAFRRSLEKDPKQVKPYLEMGRISIAQGDSLATENLLPALKIDPQNVPVQVELARAYWMRGDRAKADTYAQAVKKAAPGDPEVQFLEADMALMRGDTAGALKQLQALHTTRPLDARITTRLAQAMRGRRMDFDGQNMLYTALEINPRNPDLWYEMAHFERLLDRLDQAGNAAIKATELQPDREKAKRIAEEFKQEIEEFRKLNPVIPVEE